MTNRMTLADCEPHAISFAGTGLLVDFLRGRVLRDGISTSLTYKELQLLRYLIVHRDSVVSRIDLLSEVWGYRSTTTRTVDVHMAALRRKLEDDPRAPRYIMTVRGAGYRLCADLQTVNTVTTIGGAAAKVKRAS